MSMHRSRTVSEPPGPAVAPAVYRPPTQGATRPAVAQLKPAATVLPPPVYRPSAHSAPRPALIQLKPRGSVMPPPVYRPSPQSATRPAVSQASSAQAKSSRVGSAPPVYRPQSTVSQPMHSNASNPGSTQRPGSAGATLLPHALSRARIPTIFSPTSRSIQRMIDTPRVTLENLAGAHLTYLNIIASYSQGGSFLRDNWVEYYLQVAQALGIDPPVTDNHASGSGGGAGEGQKAKEEQGNFTRWFAENRARLESAEVDYGGGSKGKSGKRHNQKQELEFRIKKEEGKKKKGENKKQNRKQLCMDRGEHYINNNGQPCRNCGQY